MITICLSQVWADESNRMKFEAEKNGINDFWLARRHRRQQENMKLDSAAVELKPMEIRTFQFGIEQK